MRGSMKMTCWFSVCALNAAVAASVGVEDAPGLSSNLVFDAAALRMAEQDASNRVFEAESASLASAPAVDRLIPQSEEQRIFQRAAGGTYVELASGLNYRDETGAWKSSRVAPKITANGSVTFDELPVQHTFAPWSGQRVVLESSRRGGPVAKSALGGLSYYDLSSGKSALIAWVTNAPVQAYDGGVFYERAFLGVDADILYKVHPWGLEQDVVIFGGLPDPKAFGMDPAQTKLCALTELVDFELSQAGVERSGDVEPAAPAVASLEVSTKQGADWKRLYNWQPGYAFPEDGTLMVGASGAGDQAHPVAMRLFSAMGRVFLSEEVPVAHVSKSMPELLDTTVKDGVARVESIQERNPLALPPVRNDERLIAEHAPALGPQAYIRRAPRYVLDYVNYYGTNTTGVTFASGQTYYISAPYIVSGGKVTIQPGAIVKLATGAYVKVQGSASLDCRSHAVGPAYFTSAYDTNLGEVVLSGLNPASNRYETALALATTSNNVGGLVIRYAQQAIDLNGSGNSLVQDVQVWNSQSGIKTVGATNRIRNLVVHDGLRGVELNGNYDVVENSTFREVTFATSGGYILTNLTLRNCLFYNVSIAISSNGPFQPIFSGNAAYNVTTGWLGSSVVSLASNTFAVGTYGSNYFVSGSAAINAGTTNADLLGLYHYTTATNGMKETNSLVDIGFHYGTAADQDGDGMPDYLEDRSGDGTYASNSVDVSNWQTNDTDGDTLLDGAEYFTYGTNPKATNTDNDAFSDAMEIQNGSDPLNASSTLWSLSGTVSYNGSQTGTLHVLVTSFEPLTNRPALDYSFDEDYDGYTPEMTGRRREGSVFGAVWTNAGVRGGCYRFGGSARINLGPLDAASGRYALTWSVWMRHNGGGVLNGLLGNTLGGNEGIMLMQGGSNLRAYVVPQSRAQERYAETGGLVTQGVWQLVSGTYDGTQTKLYLNGDLVATSAVYSAEPIRSNLLSATAGDVGDGRGWYYNGDLDEVRIYPSTFTAHQLKSLFFEVSGAVIRRTWTTNVLASSTAFTVPNMPSGSNYWITAWRDANGNGRMDYGEAQGRYSGYVGNLSGHSNNLALTLTDPDQDGDGVGDAAELLAGTDIQASNSTPVLAAGQVIYSGLQTGLIYITARPYETIADTPVLRYSFNTSNSTIVLDESGNGITGLISNAKWTSRGMRSGAYRFDGNANINLGDLAAIEGRTGLTFGAWVNQASGYNTHGLIGKTVSGGESLMLMSAGGHVYRAYIVPQSRAQECYAEVAGVATQSFWQYVAGTYDGQQTKLYLDGQLIATSPVYAVEGIMSNNTVAALGDVAVGRGWNLNGRLDDVHIFGRCFNSNEMFNLAASIRPENIIRVITNAQPGAFAFTHLPNARKYWFEAYRDSNGNGQRDSTEAWVAWSNNPAFLQTGTTNINLALADPDTDQDGMPDWWEIKYGLNPLSSAGENGASGDPDQDQLTNLGEYQNDTDPYNFDTDGDLLADGPELTRYQTSPTNIDSDSDTYYDAEDSLIAYYDQSSQTALTLWATLPPFRFILYTVVPSFTYEFYYNDDLVNGPWLLAETAIPGEGDGVLDWYNFETGPGRKYVPGRAIVAGLASDADGDGIGSGYEVGILGTSPDMYDSSQSANGISDGDEDFDGDGLSNAAEYNSPSGGYYTPCRRGSPSPWRMDTDGDGVSDGPIGNGTTITNGPDAFPLDPYGWRDLDCDGQPDGVNNNFVSNSEPPLSLDTDSDNDGLPDASDGEPLIPRVMAVQKTVSIQSFSSSYRTMSLVGSSPLSWDTSQNNMRQIGDHLWEYIVDLNSSTGFAFKLVSNGDWSWADWGLSGHAGSGLPVTGTAVAEAGDIRVTGAIADRIRFQFNSSTRTFSVEKYAGALSPGAELFDGSSRGGYLPYAAGGNANGFGRVFGGIYFNYDANNLYVCIGNAHVEDGNVLLLFLDTKSGGPSSMAAFSGSPDALGIADNLSFGSGFNPDVALVLGRDFGDGWNIVGYPSGFGQGVYDISSGSSIGDFSGFSRSTGGGLISQWGDKSGYANAGIEVALSRTALGLTSANSFKAAAIFAGGSGGCSGGRWFSSEAYGASATSAGFGCAPVTLTGADVFMSTELAPSPMSISQSLYSDQDVMLQGFYFDVPVLIGGSHKWYRELRFKVENSVKNEFSPFSMIWLPPPQKGHWRSSDAGYAPFDHYDIGTYLNPNSVNRYTRYGTEAELIDCVAALKAKGQKPIVDLVMNHMFSGNVSRLNFTYSEHDRFEKPDPGQNNGNKYFSAHGTTNTPFESEEFFVVEGSGAGAVTNYYSDVNQRHLYMRRGLEAWGNWLTTKVGYQGYRFDVAQFIQPGFLAEFLSSGMLNQKLSVFEYWVKEAQTSPREMQTWLGLTENRALIYDGVLRDMLTNMCANGDAFNIETLFKAGLSGVAPGRTMNYVDNHDTFRPRDGLGWEDADKKGAGPYKALGYAYIMISEGLPMVFWPDYFSGIQQHASQFGFNGVTISNQLVKLIWARTNFVAGASTYRSTANKSNLFVLERLGDGNNKDGCLLAINDHSTTTYSDAGIKTHWLSKTLVNITNATDTLDTDATGAVVSSLSAGPRAYKVYVEQSKYNALGGPPP